MHRPQPYPHPSKRPVASSSSHLLQKQPILPTANDRVRAQRKERPHGLQAYPAPLRAGELTASLPPDLSSSNSDTQPVYRSTERLNQLLSMLDHDPLARLDIDISHDTTTLSSEPRHDLLHPPRHSFPLQQQHRETPASAQTTMTTKQRMPNNLPSRPNTQIHTSRPTAKSHSAASARPTAPITVPGRAVSRGPDRTVSPRVPISKELTHYLNKQTLQVLSGTMLHPVQRIVVPDTFDGMIQPDLLQSRREVAVIDSHHPEPFHVDPPNQDQGITPNVSVISKTESLPIWRTNNSTQTKPASAALSQSFDIPFTQFAQRPSSHLHPQPESPSSSASPSTFPQDQSIASAHTTLASPTIPQSSSLPQNSSSASTPSSTFTSTPLSNQALVNLPPLPRLVGTGPSMVSAPESFHPRPSAIPPHHFSTQHSSVSNVPAWIDWPRAHASPSAASPPPLHPPSPSLLTSQSTLQILPLRVPTTTTQSSSFSRDSPLPAPSSDGISYVPISSLLTSVAVHHTLPPPLNDTEHHNDNIVSPSSATVSPALSPVPHTHSEQPSSSLPSGPTSVLSSSMTLTPSRQVLISNPSLISHAITSTVASVGKTLRLSRPQRLPALPPSPDIADVTTVTSHSPSSLHPHPSSLHDEVKSHPFSAHPSLELSHTSSLASSYLAPASPRPGPPPAPVPRTSQPVTTSLHHSLSTSTDVTESAHSQSKRQVSKEAALTFVKVVYLRRWKAFWRRQRGLSSLAEDFQLRCVRVAFHGWCRLLHLARQRRVRLRARAAFIIWRDQAKHAREVMTRGDAFASQRNRGLLRKAVKAWMSWASREASRRTETEALGIVYINTRYTSLGLGTSLSATTNSLQSAPLKGPQRGHHTGFPTMEVVMAAWSTWLEAYRVRLKGRFLLGKRNTLLSRRVFHSWTAQMKYMKNSKVLLEALQAFHDRSQARCCLNKWLVYTRNLADVETKQQLAAEAEARLFEEREAIATLKMRHYHLRLAVRRWCTRLIKTKRRAEAEGMAHRLLTQHRLSSCFGHWRSASQLIAQATSDAAGMYQGNLLRRLFSDWLNAAREAVFEQAYHKRRLLLHWSKLAMRRRDTRARLCAMVVFWRWRSVACAHREAQLDAVAESHLRVKRLRSGLTALVTLRSAVYDAIERALEISRDQQNTSQEVTTRTVDEQMLITRHVRHVRQMYGIVSTASSLRFQYQSMVLRGINALIGHANTQAEERVRDQSARLWRKHRMLQRMRKGTMEMARIRVKTTEAMVAVWSLRAHRGIKALLNTAHRARRRGECEVEADKRWRESQLRRGVHALFHWAQTASLAKTSLPISNQGVGIAATGEEGVVVEMTGCEEAAPVSNQRKAIVFPYDMVSPPHRQRATIATALPVEVCDGADAEMFSVNRGHQGGEDNASALSMRGGHSAVRTQQEESVSLDPSVDIVATPSILSQHPHSLPSARDTTPSRSPLSTNQEPRVITDTEALSAHAGSSLNLSSAGSAITLVDISASSPSTLVPPLPLASLLPHEEASSHAIPQPHTPSHTFTSDTCSRTPSSSRSPSDFESTIAKASLSLDVSLAPPPPQPSGLSPSPLSPSQRLGSPNRLSIRPQHGIPQPSSPRTVSSKQPTISSPRSPRASFSSIPTSPRTILSTPRAPPSLPVSPRRSLSVERVHSALSPRANTTSITSSSSSSPSPPTVHPSHDVDVQDGHPSQSSSSLQPNPPNSSPSPQVSSPTQRRLLFDSLKMNTSPPASEVADPTQPPSSSSVTDNSSHPSDDTITLDSNSSRGNVVVEMTLSSPLRAFKVKSKDGNLPSVLSSLSISSTHSDMRPRADRPASLVSHQAQQSSLSDSISGPRSLDLSHPSQLRKSLATPLETSVDLIAIRQAAVRATHKQAIFAELAGLSRSLGSSVSGGLIRGVRDSKGSTSGLHEGELRHKLHLLGVDESVVNDTLNNSMNTSRMRRVDDDDDDDGNDDVEETGSGERSEYSRKHRMAVLMNELQTRRRLFRRWAHTAHITKAGLAIQENHVQRTMAFVMRMWRKRAAQTSSVTTFVIVRHNERLRQSLHQWLSLALTRRHARRYLLLKKMWQAWKGATETVLQRHRVVQRIEQRAKTRMKRDFLRAWVRAFYATPIVSREATVPLTSDTHGGNTTIPRDKVEHGNLVARSPRDGVRAASTGSNSATLSRPTRFVSARRRWIRGRDDSDSDDGENEDNEDNNNDSDDDLGNDTGQDVIMKVGGESKDEREKGAGIKNGAYAPISRDQTHGTEGIGEERRKLDSAESCMPTGASAIQHVLPLSTSASTQSITGPPPPPSTLISTSNMSTIPMAPSTTQSDHMSATSDTGTPSLNTRASLTSDISLPPPQTASTTESRHSSVPDHVSSSYNQMTSIDSRDALILAQLSREVQDHISIFSMLRPVSYSLVHREPQPVAAVVVSPVKAIHPGSPTRVTQSSSLAKSTDNPLNPFQEVSETSRHNGPHSEHGKTRVTGDAKAIVEEQENDDADSPQLFLPVNESSFEYSSRHRVPGSIQIQSSGSGSNKPPLPSSHQAPSHVPYSAATPQSTSQSSRGLVYQNRPLVHQSHRSLSINRPSSAMVTSSTADRGPASKLTLLKRTMRPVTSRPATSRHPQSKANPSMSLNMPSSVLASTGREVADQQRSTTSNDISRQSSRHKHGSMLQQEGDIQTEQGVIGNTALISDEDLDEAIAALEKEIAQLK